MKTDLHEEINVPQDLTVEIVDDILLLKKDQTILSRILNSRIPISIQDNKIILDSKRSTKNEKKLFYTFKAHINNMIKGLTESFQYKLQISFVHFPMNVSLDKEKNQLVIKNFIGEKIDRIIKLIPGVDIKVGKEIIEISSPDIELAGQCAANIEKGSKVKGKDRRIYQDGIYIIEKPGRKFL